MHQRRVAHIRDRGATRGQGRRIEERRGERGPPLPCHVARGPDGEFAVGGERRGREGDDGQRGRADARGKPPDPAPGGTSR